MAAGDTVTGGCGCGAVRYRFTDRGFRPYACHCHGCQRRQGSAFAVNQQVVEADLVVEGSVIEGQAQGLTGATIRLFACPHCLTRIWTFNPTRPGIVTLRTGTRDDSPQLVPAFHIWTSRKQPWIVLPEGVTALEEGPADAAEWMRLILPGGMG